MPPLVCPGCRKPKMVEVEENAVKRDVCPECAGIWLDTGELEAMGCKLPPGGIDYIGERRCPRCDRPMRIRPSKVVELDVCPGCCGIYLDAGELRILRDVAKLAPNDDRAEPRFVCEQCHQERPFSQQVIGEQRTVCEACAKKLKVKDDPRGRRQVAQAAARADKPQVPAREPVPSDADLLVKLLFSRFDKIK